MIKKIIFILIAFLMILSCGKKTETDIKEEIKAIVMAYFGDVSINGKALTATGAAVKYNDTIETGKKSFCEIIVNDKNILKLGGETKLVFKLSDLESTLELSKGWLSGVTKKIYAKERKYNVKTPTAVAAIRGTSFCTKVESEDSTYFCVCNGIIELKKAGGETADVVESSHHLARRFKKEKSGAIAVDNKPGMLYHSDKDVEALAKKIDVVIDWKKVD